MRRFFEILLVVYALFIVFYLICRFLLQVQWSWLMLLHNFAPYLFLPVLIGFILAFLMQARRVTGIYLLLLIGALLWFVPILLPKPQNTSSEDSIRLVSFNIFMANQELNRAVEWLLAQDADLIFLQEVRAELPELEAAYPYFDYSFSNKSLALFSRYPISSNNDFSLEGFTQKRYILEIEGEFVAIYHIHLVIPVAGRDGDFILFRYDESYRNQQIEALMTSLEAETLPIILAGDFNMSEWSPIYNRLAGNFHDAYRNGAWGLGTSWPVAGIGDIPDNFLPLFRLDYLWYSEGIEASSAYMGSPLGSDHLPLIVELQLKE